MHVHANIIPFKSNLLLSHRVACYQHNTCSQPRPQALLRRQKKEPVTHCLCIYEKIAYFTHHIHSCTRPLMYDVAVLVL